jgi:hypothetical protein
MRNMYYVDMHCHPSIKPYSWYISDRGNLWDCRNVRKSLWYDDPPNESDRAINRHIGLTKFTQSDFRTLTKGDVRIISACLSPIERGLFVPQGFLRRFGLRLLKFGLELNEEYIRQVRDGNRNYFEELKDEHQYFINEESIQNNRVFPTQFKLISNFNEIETNREYIDTDRIYIFFSIEGCHIFNNGGLENQFNQNVVGENIREVKNWDHPPLYASMAHHIYNDLCGHAQSLPHLLHILTNQKDGMGEGFKDMGRFVLDELLCKDNGRRIYIDIKHMSAQSRLEYYERLNVILEDENEEEPIPVLASHGAVNGLESINNQVKNNNNLSGNIYQSENELNFDEEPINFFDEEIIRMEKTEGFLGIQLDERKLCSTLQRRRNKRIKERGKQLYHQAGLVWKQIRYIAELLDRNGKFGWGTATIGSDYDGGVNPPNGYWTSADFGILEENLIHHAFDYFQNHHTRLRPENQLLHCSTVQEKAREVIDMFMRRNALRFLKNFLR